VRYGRTVERAHLSGITRAVEAPALTSELQRPLSAYAELVEVMA